MTVNTTYYDLAFGGLFAPQRDSTQKAILHTPGSELTMPVVRKLGTTQYLWTCRAIGVNSSGNANTTADRAAVEWFKINLSSGVSIAETDRIRDSGANPKFYFSPSMTVNKLADMVLGFTGSSVNEYYSAYYTGRLNNGTWQSSPVRYFGGITWFHNTQSFRWGDYSATALDPDGLRVWTIQEHATTRFSSEPGVPNAHGTRIALITPF
jgi:hypothetical protein